MVMNWSATCFVALALLGCLSWSGGQLQKPQPQRPNTAKFTPEVSPQTTDIRCSVEDRIRVPCGPTSVTAEQCRELSCCFDGRQCYYGRAVTVQCTKDAQFIVVAARDATLPNIDLESIIMLGGNDAPCNPIASNSQFAVYQFPVTACGTLITEESGTIVYQNRMVSTYEVAFGPRASITRDSEYEVLFQCRYLGISIESVVMQLLGLDPPLPFIASGPLRVALRLANGECLTKGCADDDVAYSSYYTEAEYPVTKVLRETVYVEVNILDRTDPNIVLTLGHCWTTNSPNPHSLPQWDLLIDGCPDKNDHYLSTLIPVRPSPELTYPSHYRRFKFQMFTFVDSTQNPTKEMVFIHCSTTVCSPAQGSCEPQCNSKRKRRDDAAAKRETTGGTVASSGQIIFLATGEEGATVSTQ